MGEQDALRGWVRLFCFDIVILGLAASLLALWSPELRLPFAASRIGVIVAVPTILTGIVLCIALWFYT